MKVRLLFYLETNEHRNVIGKMTTFLLIFFFLAYFFIIYFSDYAALIKELNSMPVSNDTLKKRKRKMEIEDELKRLDEVIKIFQKPKVFVKSNA